MWDSPGKNPLLQGDLLDPGIELASLISPALTGRFFTTSATWEVQHKTPAAAAAESLQSCPTLCNPIDGSPSGSPVPGTLQARALEWGAISFSMTLDTKTQNCEAMNYCYLSQPGFGKKISESQFCNELHKTDVDGFKIFQGLRIL